MTTAGPWRPHTTRSWSGWGPRPGRSTRSWTHSTGAGCTKRCGGPGGRPTGRRRPGTPTTGSARRSTWPTGSGCEGTGMDWHGWVTIGVVLAVLAALVLTRVSADLALL